MIYSGLLLFFVLEYVRPSHYLPFIETLKITTIVPVVLAVAAMVTKARVRNADLLREHVTKIVLFFLALLGLSVVMSVVTFYAFETLKRVVGYLLIYWVIAKHVDDRRKLLGLFRTLVAVHLALAVLNPQLLTNPEVRSYLVSAPFLGDGNDFGLSVNITIPMCYALVVTAPSKRGKLLYALALLVLIACVVATQSRGATVGLVCVAVYYWSRTKRKLATALTIAVVVALILVFAPGAYFDRMQTISTTEGSARGRIDGWVAAWEASLQHPVFGVGAGHFNVSIRRLTAHSIYFLVLGELGFPGLVTIILLIAFNLAGNRRLIAFLLTKGKVVEEADREIVAALSGSMIALAVNGAFLSAAYYPHLWIVAGVSVAARRVIRERYSFDRSALAPDRTEAVPARG